jgi:hypothetical protein
MLLDLDCKKPKHSLRMLLLLKTALSYANDTSVSTWDEAFSLHTASQLKPLLLGKRNTSAPIRSLDHFP